MKKIGEQSFMNHFYNSYFPNHNRAFHINNLQKGVEKNLPGVEGVDFAERGRSTPKGVGVGRSAIYTPRPKVNRLAAGSHIYSAPDSSLVCSPKVNGLPPMGM